MNVRNNPESKWTSIVGKAFAEIGLPTTDLNAEARLGLIHQ